MMCGSAFSFQEQLCKFSSVISHNIRIPKQWTQGIKIQCTLIYSRENHKMDEKTAASFFCDDHQGKHSLS